ncbi:MAG: DUF4056 domain-containing protein [Myxococcales bacterium]|nr:DUF4056 domain-containing protein [Myxococcales bacterium]
MTPTPSRSPRRAVLALAGFTAVACAPKWKTETLIDPREVARALDDPAHIGTVFDPSSVPLFDPPEKLRPCCAFGQDLTVKVGQLPLPDLLKNVLGVDDLGPHAYDRGSATRERNGLVYTCRGGFIDIAHVRDNADRALFLSLRIARALPSGVTVDMPWEGTGRRIVVAPLPEGVLERHGRWQVATALAAWANHQLSNWHEVVTWYGWESVKGVPERVSAFSPEDIYSNTLGTKLGVGLVMNREMRSREEYDAAMQAWLLEGLRRLGVVSRDEAHAAMRAVDGRWWDSNSAVPEFKLVLKRSLDVAAPSRGWIVADTVDDPKLKTMCQDSPPPLALTLPEKLGELAIAELVDVRFEFTNKWIPEKFPIAVAEGTVVGPEQLPQIIEDVRAGGQIQLGPGFDDPKARPEKDAAR